jgi:hypothetical protein
MRILKKKEFLKEPDGTVYSKYESLGMVSDLAVKTYSYENDWVYYCLIGEIDANDTGEFCDMFSEAEGDSSIELKLELENTRRDGMYDDSDMFVVYSKEDIKGIISCLNDLVK